MKVVLINPYVPNDKFGTTTPWEVPQLGLGYIAAVLEKKGHHVTIIDAYILKIEIQRLLKMVELLQPAIMGISCNVYTAKFACFTARKLKERFATIPLIMGGAFPTISFNYLLTKKFADYVVIGEGEETIVDLLNEIQNPTPNYSRVLGIAFLQGNTPIKTPPRPFIENLDALPYPAWHLFPPLKKYSNLRGVMRKPYLPLMTSRGCPFECIWCTKYVHGRKSRLRSPESIIAEMKYFANKFGVKEFAFMDDGFAINEYRVKKFCVLFLKAGLKLSVNLYNGIRVDSVSDKLLNFLYAIGLSRITVGIESGNDCILKTIKKHLTLVEAQEAINIIKKHHFLSDTYFMLGFPEDTPKTMLQTIRFAKKLNPTHAYFFITIPFLGTELYDIVQKQATLIKKYDLGIPFHIVEGEAIYETKNFSFKVLESLFRYAYRTFYLRPGKILHLIKDYAILFILYRSTQEFKWLFSQAILLLRLLKINPAGTIGSRENIRTK